MTFHLRQWLGSLFSPISFATDENGLYEAFWLRRKEHGKGRGWAMGLKPGGRAGGIKFLASGVTTAVGSIFIVIFLLILIPRYSLATVPVVVAFIVLLVFLRQHMGGERTVMPRTLSHLLLHAQPQKQAMLEIWMTGAGGWEAAWAVYRESRPAEWKATASVLAILYGIVVSMYLTLAQPSFLPAATVAVSGLVLVLSCAVAMNSGTGLAGMTAVQRKWKQDLEGPATQAVKGIATIPVAVGFAFGGIILLGLITELVTQIWKNFPEAIRSLPAEYIVSFLLCGTSALLWLARGRISYWNESRCAKTATQLETLYNQYIRKIVIKDPDATWKPRKNESTPGRHRR